MTVPKEVRAAMKAAMRELPGGCLDTERQLDAALSVLGECGYALAKIEPTQAMVLAGRATQYDDKTYSVIRVWDAMLAASLEQER